MRSPRGVRERDRGGVAAPFRGSPGRVGTPVLRLGEREIGVLVYAGLFMSEDAGIQKILKDKAAAGARVRILLGDPDSQVVADRGDDEGIGDTVPAKIRNALALYRPLRQVQGVEFRFHRTVLYNSIYRADDRCWSTPTCSAWPRRRPQLGTCASSPGASWPASTSTAFERVWDTATPVDGG